MANITNLSEFLTDIADAIRTKNSTTEPIAAENFDTEILNLETGGGGIKQFATEEEMNADENPSEGDLAVVYGESLQAWDGSSKIMALTFPETVTLSSASTGSCYGYAYGDVYIDIQGNVSSTSAQFDIYGDSSYTITYTSADGLTYTRTDTYAETIVIADKLTTVRMYEWDAICGYFMQTTSYYFGGLFEYVPYTDDTKYLLYNFQDNNVQNVVVTGEISKQDITTVMNLVKANNISSVTSSGSVTIAKKTDNIIEVYYTASSTSAFYQYKVMLNGVLHIGFTNSSTSTLPLYKYVVDLTTNTITSSTEIPTAYSMSLNSASGSTTNVCVYPSVLDIIGFTTVYFNDFSIYSSSVSGFEANTETNVVMNYGSDVKTAYGVSKHYDYANSQLSAIAANDLLPNKIAYGSEGVVTGDGSVYNEIPSAKIYELFYGDSLVNNTIPQDYYDTLIYSHSSTVKPAMAGLLSTDVSTSCNSFYAPYCGAKNTYPTLDNKYRITKGSSPYTITNMEDGSTMTVTIGVSTTFKYIIDHKALVYSRVSSVAKLYLIDLETGTYTTVASHYNISVAGLDASKTRIYYAAVDTSGAARIAYLNYKTGATTSIWTASYGTTGGTDLNCWASLTSKGNIHVKMKYYHWNGVSYDHRYLITSSGTKVSEKLNASLSTYISNAVSEPYGNIVMLEDSTYLYYGTQKIKRSDLSYTTVSTSTTYITNWDLSYIMYISGANREFRDQSGTLVESFTLGSSINSMVAIFPDRLVDGKLRYAIASTAMGYACVDTIPAYLEINNTNNNVALYKAVDNAHKFNIRGKILKELYALYTEPDYDGTITPEEYDTALDTATEILS